MRYLTIQDNGQAKVVLKKALNRIILRKSSWKIWLAFVALESDMTSQKEILTEGGFPSLRCGITPLMCFFSGQLHTIIKRT